VFPAVIAGIVVVGIIAVILVASSGSDDGGKAAAAEISAEVRVEGTPLPKYAGTANDAAVGLAAPTLESVNFQAESVTAGGRTGSPYALVFLAHWCPNCQEEVPRLVAVGRNGQIAGVDVTGVTTGTSAQNPNYPPSEWLDREDWDFPVLLDDARGTAANAYGLPAYPFMVFVDADGEVVGRISGQVAEEDLTAIFTALAKGQPLPLPGAGSSSTR
jgi:thiol-disulfide isomerase/thioredoxin